MPTRRQTALSSVHTSPVTSSWVPPHPFLHLPEPLHPSHVAPPPPGGPLDPHIWTTPQGSFTPGQGSPIPTGHPSDNVWPQNKGVRAAGQGTGAPAAPHQTRGEGAEERRTVDAGGTHQEMGAELRTERAHGEQPHSLVPVACLFRGSAEDDRAGNVLG